MDFSPIGSELATHPAVATPLRIAMVGHVDHGKSTIIGRLFYETGSLPEGRYESVKSACEARGVDFTWAFLVDALKAERDQNVTIDTAQMWLRTQNRDYVIIDAPGHVEFVQNMITGAASADAAFLIIDAEEGVQEQTRRHGYLLDVMGVRQVAIVINKMDRADYSEKRFREVVDECTTCLRSLGLSLADNARFIPASAQEGDNIATRSGKLAWYEGPTLIETLESFVSAPSRDNLPLRFPVQSVYRFDHRRILAGWILSGRISVGDEVMFSPSKVTARIASIESWNTDVPMVSARAGQSIGVTLDRPLFIERGEMISHTNHTPVLSSVFDAKVFWCGHEPVTIGARYKMRLNSAEYAVTVESIKSVVNLESLSFTPADEVKRNEIAEVVLRTKGLASLDSSTADSPNGRFVLVDGYDIAGGGLVNTEHCVDAGAAESVKSANITRVAHSVPLQQRWQTNGHKSGILWLTGLSGSGKSTLAFLLEQYLLKRGVQVYTLDGDNLRHGLCSDLGFSPRDRAENIRRAGEMALGFAEAGILVVTAFISPYRSDRQRVRQIAGNLFHEIHIKADLETCEKRDPKGLYRKARNGEIAEFTGISAPYEVPENPELVIDTASGSEEESLDVLLEYVERHFGARTLAHDEADLKVVQHR